MNKWKKLKQRLEAAVAFGEQATYSVEYILEVMEELEIAESKEGLKWDTAGFAAP